MFLLPKDINIIFVGVRLRKDNALCGVRGSHKFTRLLNVNSMLNASKYSAKGLTAAHEPKKH